MLCCVVLCCVVLCCVVLCCVVLCCVVLCYVMLGPGRTGQIFVYFAKKSVTSSVRQVRPVIFLSNKFCQALPNFKGAIVLPQSRTNFCQA